MKLLVMSLRVDTPLIQALHLAGFSPSILIEHRTSLSHLAAFYGSRFWKRPGQVLGEVAYQAYKILSQRSSQASDMARIGVDIKVDSINSDECLSFVREFGPDVVFLDGTSIARRPLIERIRPGKFCNIHCGVTPAYRGSGNPFALIKGDVSRLGVTFHNVDSGIDTGVVIGRKHVPLRPDDGNLHAFQHRCYCEGVALAVNWLQGRPVVDDFCNVPLSSTHFPQLTLRSYFMAERALARLRPT
jgi:hypothetical protein